MHLYRPSHNPGNPPSPAQTRSRGNVPEPQPRDKPQTDETLLRWNMRAHCLLLVASAQGAWLAPRSVPVRQAAPASTALGASRREAVIGLGGLLTTLAAPAVAFDNAIPEYASYADKAKRKGTPPKDLGVAKRTINEMSMEADPRTFDGLRGCDGKPNCFSTTGDELVEDRMQTGVDTLIQPWKPPAGDAAPFQSLVKAVKAYQPGQGYIDGGGFKVIKETDSYLYVQFEALKKGYIDDVEFYLSDGLVQVRSSSRVGQTDFGVNAIRLNYVAAALRQDGWTIEEITEKKHPDYFNAANDARDVTYDKDRRKLDGFEEKTGENGRLERPNIG